MPAELSQELPSRRLRNIPRLVLLTEADTACNLLARWFLVGVPVDCATATRLLPADVLRILAESGLLRASGTSLEPRCRVAPIEGQYLVSDPPSRMESGGAEDLVLWPNPTTRLLQRFTIRRPSRATLDLGTGCGMQALLAAVHSQTIVATDLNERATRIAEFNARLNGVEGIEFFSGDGFAPVAGRRFDLIVSNPPFFITPANRLMFCENPLDLDLFCRRLVREAPLHLEEGGFAQMVLEWAEVRGQPWRERLAEWFEASSCDVWVLKNYTKEPSAYALDRLRETSYQGPEQDAAAYTEWMAYYREHGVEAIHGGLLAMRRRSGRNWMCLEEMPLGAKDSFGDAIADGFAARDFLQSHPDDSAWLEVRPRLSPDVVLRQEFTPADGGWAESSLNLTLVRGVPCTIKLQPMVAQFLAACDGKRTLDELIADLAGRVPADRAQVARECVGVTRRMVERGCVRVT